VAPRKNLHAGFTTGSRRDHGSDRLSPLPGQTRPTEMEEMHAMNTTPNRRSGTAVRVALLALVTLVVLLARAAPAAAQVGSLYYREVEKDGRVYVFNTPEKFKLWEASGDMGVSITLIGRGPNGETVVAENETALDLYLFKHGLEAFDRPTPKPTPTPPPTVLKVADGELKFGMLLQAWYVGDDSQPGTGTSYLGNTTGNNTFRLRRGELKLSGKINKSWGFELMVDPAKSQTFTAGSDDKILQDLAIAYIGLKGHEFGIGQKKIALTEEGLRSSSEIDFAERARITRVIGDQRQAGLFYKGEFGEKFGAYASITNGTFSNVNDDNDLLFTAARFDFKPVKGMVLGVSGGTGSAQVDHRTRDRLGAHFRWDGTETLPLWLRFEYGTATDGQGAGKADIDRAGYYGSALCTFAKQFQVGVRYEEYDQNTEVDNDKLRIITGGFHYLIKGKNINLKADWMGIEQEGRTVNNVPDEQYNQFVFAAQLAF
jgi:hypothetical protein